MQTSIEIEGDSDEAIALALLQMILRGEGKEDGADRRWILSTYRQCLSAVRGEEWAEAGPEDEEDEEEDELDEDELDDEEEEEDEEDAAPARGGGR
jgi:hypothetical protein